MKNLKQKLLISLIILPIASYAQNKVGQEVNIKTDDNGVVIEQVVEHYEKVVVHQNSDTVGDCSFAEDRLNAKNNDLKRYAEEFQDDFRKQCASKSDKVSCHGFGKKLIITGSHKSTAYKQHNKLTNDHMKEGRIVEGFYSYMCNWKGETTTEVIETTKTSTVKKLDLKPGDINSEFIVCKPEPKSRDSLESEIRSKILNQVPNEFIPQAREKCKVSIKGISSDTDVKGSCITDIVDICQGKVTATSTPKELNKCLAHQRGVFVANFFKNKGFKQIQVSSEVVGSTPKIEINVDCPELSLTE